MRARITTSCKSEDSRYTRLNLLGWALLCPHARDLLWHGITPLEQPLYPTAEESKSQHKVLKKLVDEHLNAFLGDRILATYPEYEHVLGIYRGDDLLCARSKADLVYNVKLGKTLATLYVEIASSRINVAKPWQAILRAIALYYELRLPVIVMIVSPFKIMYKVVEDRDQVALLKLVDKPSSNFEANSNLCSLCELASQCPYRVI
ncbi:MAG: hypothetical protein F7C38_07465 [Desulfurococcales archaeon]|nr:hypothetical protein [Desulfurococcales archaeon]